MGRIRSSLTLVSVVSGLGFMVAGIWPNAPRKATGIAVLGGFYTEPWRSEF